VKAANPVVMKITTDTDEVIDEKDDVDKHIKEYFEAIYKAPSGRDGVSTHLLEDQLLDVG
jgi:hypothetical protein